MPLGNSETVMFFGADVATVASKGKSYAAVVGSYDLDFCKYAVRVSEQVNENDNKSSQEIILNMEEMAYSLLKKFEEKNKKLPTKIVFYRDGVDSGQFQGVLDQEMFALKKACAKFNQNIKITMIVVVKRHHTKFYPTRAEDAVIISLFFTSSNIKVYIKVSLQNNKIKIKKSCTSAKLLNFLQKLIFDIILV